MLERMRSWLRSATGTTIEAAATLPTEAPLKPPKPGGLSIPSFFKSAKPARNDLPRTDRRLLNTDLTTLRTGTDTYKVVRDFVAASPELGSAVFNYVRLGISEKYKAVGRNPDGTINPEATALAQQLLARWDRMPLDGVVNGSTGIHQVSEQLARELVLYGGLCSELVLDKARIPQRVQPISTTQIVYLPLASGKGVEPFQQVGQDKISLLTPTVVILTLDQDLLEPYSASMLESALQPTLFGEQFANSLRKVVDRAIHPRVHAKVDEELFRKHLSPEAQMDSELANQELAALVASLESKLAGLNPEDALVYLDSLDIHTDNPASSGLSSEYETLQKYIDARLTSGARAMPAVMGKGGQQNTASTEAMLFVRSVEGVVKIKLDAMWSRHLTTAVRLMGVDAYVDFSFDPVSLRPQDEMQAFRQTKLSINKDLLSMGFITDDEFSIDMTGELPPPGHVPLSGTMFASKSAAAPVPQEASNSGSTLNQKLASDAPAQGRGGNKKVQGN